jgi:hypothetical protein
MTKVLFALMLSLPLTLLTSCADDDSSTTTDNDGDDGKADGGGPLGSFTTDEPIRLPSAGAILTAITQPGVTVALDAQGFSLNKLMSVGLAATPANKVNTQAIYDQTAWYKVVVDGVAADVVARRREVNGVYGAQLSGSTRAFDYGYLRSPESTFELIGVVNRIDRRDFDSTATCGELRFVYKLKYKKANSPGSFSRLPFSLNVIFAAPNDGQGCASFANRWKLPTGIDTGVKYVDWIKAQAGSTAGYSFKQIEVNMQANRIPSESVPELGGSAEYFLRVYSPLNTTLQPKPLENTPDVERIAADPALKAELVTFIQNNLASIDKGTFNLPAKFLATKLTSVSTHGVFRMKNRPFSSLFKPTDLGLPAGVFANASIVNSPAGLLARMDDATCSGCHQGASIAGFHMVGTENLTKLNALNATRIGTSAHFNSEEPKRKAYVQAILNGQAPATTRAISFLESKNVAGAHCIESSNASAFKQGYGCQGDATCTNLERNAAMSVRIGTCLHTPVQRFSPDNGITKATGVAGEPCFGGDHTSSRDTTRDKLSLGGQIGGYCLAPVQGTPAGLVTRGCGYDGADSVHTAQAGEVCAFNGGAGFDACAASGDFSQCLGNASTFSRGLRGMCDESTACRDDFICQRYFDLSTGRPALTPADRAANAPRSAGFCVPTYFLFQMRVDGHAASATRWLD